VTERPTAIDYAHAIQNLVVGQFTTADARIKLRRHYPVIKPVNSGRSNH
jgi:hypothetical protein